MQVAEWLLETKCTMIKIHGQLTNNSMDTFKIETDYVFIPKSEVVGKK